MIRLFSRRVSSALNIFPLPQPAPVLMPLYKFNDKEKTSTPIDEGYRILIDVCHETKTVYVDHDMSNYDELNDLPRIIKTFGCLYPNYTLRQ